jgi:outer membrane receptor protein involved in Fe transport
MKPRAYLRHLLVALLTFACVPGLDAQETGTGTVVGKVLDAETGGPVYLAQVQVVGGSTFVLSRVDGSFVITGVPAGSFGVTVQCLGYQAKTITGLELEPQGAVQVNVTLPASAIQIDALVVTAAQERGSVAVALDEQRSATNVVNSVTSQQIARSPDGDAAQAIQRVSGVTTQDGKFVFVRGLGGRYTTTSVNNARVPSPEPETRVVPLDLFPSGLLQSITTYKTFTPDREGDFAGAVVDIKTREFPAHRAGTLQLGGGYAGGATGADLLTATGVGGEGLAMVNHGRDLPSELRALGNFQGVNLTQQDYNHLVSLFRDSWSPRPTIGTPLGSGSASVGGNDPVFGHRIGYLVSGTFSTDTDLKSDQHRSQAYPGSTPGETVEYNPFTGNSAQRSVAWGGLANLSTLIGEGSRLSFDGLYNRSADNTAQVEDGFNSYDATPLRVTSMEYLQRSMGSAQLSGEHGYGRNHLDWRVAANTVRRFEPDRSEFAQVIDTLTDGSPVYRWLTTGSGGAVRTFADLHENAKEAAGDYRVDLGGGAAPAFVKVGGLFRRTSRDADEFSYVITARPSALTDAIRELPPDQLFDGRFETPTDSLFTVAPLSQGGSYTAEDRLYAGYLMADVPLSDAIRVVGGARYESDHLDVHAQSTLGTPVEPAKVWNDWLPSLALNVQLTQNQQLRLSVARTLARPEYREITPIISRDVIGGENIQGDSSLTQTHISSADVRWEIYPGPDEIFGVSLFAKHFTDPIEQVYGSGSGGTGLVFYTNAKGADNYGVEIEARKNLSFVGDALAPLTVFLNTTFMRSRIHLLEGTNNAATNLDRAMVGQAPYVINGGMTYAPLGGAWSGTLLYNRTGPRITEAGSNPLPDATEQPRDVLDLSLRVGLWGSIQLRADAKNLLDSPYEILQGTIKREYYREGRTFQTAITIQR